MNLYYPKLSLQIWKTFAKQVVENVQDGSYKSKTTELCNNKKKGQGCLKVFLGYYLIRKIVNIKRDKVKI